MTAYYPVFDDEVERGPPGMPGIGFKLTNDGNYDMEVKVLRNVLDPEELTDCATKNYFDKELKERALTLKNDFFDAKHKIIRNQGHPEEAFDSATKIYVDETVEELKKISLINHDAKGENIHNLKDPENAKHAVNKQYFENNALILSGGSYDARNKNISNVKEPENPNDVVIQKHLDYSCILWDTVNRSYFAHNQRISSVKWPKKDTEIVLINIMWI
ncbi:uncharacterized protein TNCV_3428191 [Trichonephila clavipes]|nr:uncharacterized protein TNCV_3428191 [Trichonephila clavipes]